MDKLFASVVRQTYIKNILNVWFPLNINLWQTYVTIVSQDTFDFTCVKGFSNYGGGRRTNKLHAHELVDFPLTRLAKKACVPVPVFLLGCLPQQSMCVTQLDVT
jgi:hypothetical protein